ncbi:alanine racemase [Nocardioides daejeonensis]|uniref:alanine racemase n=1 Tax=Nocardioides daejeonensis TaxID=1046556 RepID=UPI000D7507DD|nr:alanine racemase [Nocardioides daejeonensis]
MIAPLHDPGAGPRSRPGSVVHLDAVAANTRSFADRVPGHLMAVVKADGFGHGAVEVARTALLHGATWLGVTSLEEALGLRDAGLVAPVLSWLNPVDADFATAVRRNVDVAVSDRDHLLAVARAGRTAGRRARVHLHLDTGMARDGAAPGTWAALCAAARVQELAGTVQVVGVMGHLACASAGSDASGRAAFRVGVALARRAGLRPQLRHLAATAATLTDPESHYDLVRVGAGLVGIDPSGTTSLAPALTLTAPVIGIQRVPADTGVGYDHTFRTGRATTLALLGVGYADGLPRIASGRAEVWLAGARRRVVGRISMDQTVVDLGDDGVLLGAEATVFGPTAGAPAGSAPTVDEWAEWADTIPHEIVTGLGARLGRLHRGGAVSLGAIESASAAVVPAALRSVR